MSTKSVHIGTPGYVFGWPPKPEPQPWLVIVLMDQDWLLMAACKVVETPAFGCCGGIAVMIDDACWTSLAGEFADNDADSYNGPPKPDEPFTIGVFAPGKRLCDVRFLVGWVEPIVDDLGYLANEYDFSEAGDDLSEFQQAFVNALNALALNEGRVDDSEPESESGVRWNDPNGGGSGL
jgi:hypothetical protein